jgi:hypothetical protein
MSYVAVVGGGSHAAEWITRYLASGFDVVTDDVSTVGETVADLWPAADRLGLFPGASRERLRQGSPHDIAAATLVHVLGGPTPLGIEGLLADSDTVRGCSPVHLVPLVEVQGPNAPALTRFYRGIGMAPVPADAPAHERWQLGEGLVQLTDGEPDALIAVMRALRQ